MEPEAKAARRQEAGSAAPGAVGDPSRWRTSPERISGHRFGCSAMTEPEGLPPEFLLVPLPGETPGYAGVAIESPRGWMLHAGGSCSSRTEVAAGRQ